MARTCGARSPSRCRRRARPPTAINGPLKAPPLPLGERFRREFERLAGGAPAPDARLGIAVSGGPDSLALLLLAAASYPGCVVAATVDHGLRPEAADEADHVAAVCAARGIPHATLRPERPIGGNLQAEARRARYALLEDWRAAGGIAWIATAHHADDQLETVLMRLLRGSGVDGLSAIRPINGRIVRPLLGMRRAELAAWLAAQGVDPVVDPSNEDIRFDRARIRLALADFPDFDPTLLMRSSEALREASEALDWAAAREAEARVTRTSDGVILDPRGLPRELLRRLVLACVARLDPGLAPRGPAVDLLLDALDRGEKRTIGGILCDHVRRDGASAWRFAPAPPRRTG